MQRILIGLAGLYGASAVVMAAAAAHGLNTRLDAGMLQQVRNALQIQGWHALALIGIALWLPQGGLFARAAGLTIALGTFAFCGAVYALALLDVRLPMVAPLGGSVLIVGWLLLTVSAFAARG